jgi:transposase/transposase-like protein
MYTKQEIIIRSYRSGQSQRQISRDLSISRKTVKKHIVAYELQLSASRSSKEAHSIYLSTAQVYKVSNRGKFRLTREISEEIDQMLLKNQEKLSLGQRKQLLKKIDILEVLQEKGYQIGYTTVCNYISSKTQQATSKEAYIRQIYTPGSVCEFDWGEVKLIINGHPCRFNMAVFTSAYSNYRYAMLYDHQDSLSFMESHVSFFSHVGGVYHSMVYDNMRVAVARFVGKYEKEPTRALLDMRGHYQFTHRFCNARRGNEKGHVERSVEYIRRKAFGYTSSFSDQDSAIAHLERSLTKINNTKQQLTGRTAQELFNEEKAALYNLPMPLKCCDITQSRVDKYATISYRGNRYSVPDHLVGHFVDVKLFSKKIEIYNDDVRVALHQRNYGKQQWIINIEHYLSTFKRKPGALAGSVALAQSGYLKELYHQYFDQTPRDFIELLHYCSNNQIDNEKLKESVDRLNKICIEKIDTEQIIALLGNKHTMMPSKPLAGNETALKSKEQLLQIARLF